MAYEQTPLAGFFDDSAVGEEGWKDPRSPWQRHSDKYGEARSPAQQAALRRSPPRRRTPLMSDLPTPVNRPPAMAGFTDDPRSLLMVGVIGIAAYILFSRKH